MSYNDTVAHYAAIQCPRQRTIASAMQQADIAAPALILHPVASKLLLISHPAERLAWPEHTADLQLACKWLAPIIICRRKTVIAKRRALLFLCITCDWLNMTELHRPYRHVQCICRPRVCSAEANPCARLMPTSESIPGPLILFPGFGNFKIDFRDSRESREL